MSQPTQLHLDRWVQACEEIVGRRAYGEHSGKPITIPAGTIGYMYKTREYVGGIVAFPTGVVGVPYHQLHPARIAHTTEDIALLLDLSAQHVAKVKSDQIRYFKMDAQCKLPPHIHSGFNPDSVKHEEQVIVENHLFHLIVGNDKATMTAPMRDIPFVVQLFEDDFVFVCSIDTNLVAVSYKNVLNIPDSSTIAEELKVIDETIASSTDSFMTTQLENDRDRFASKIKYTWLLHGFLFALIEHEQTKLKSYLSSPLAWSDFIRHNRPESVEGGS